MSDQSGSEVVQETAFAGDADDCEAISIAFLKDGEWHPEEVDPVDDQGRYKLVRVDDDE